MHLPDCSRRFAALLLSASLGWSAGAAEFHVSGTLDSFDVQDDELRVVFKSPAHRGDDAGPAWRFVIDVVAVLVLLSAGTGVVLWLLVPKWRRWGIAAITVCVAASGAVYLCLVP